jgi:hypothetical protein
MHDIEKPDPVVCEFTAAGAPTPAHSRISGEIKTLPLDGALCPFQHFNV